MKTPRWPEKLISSPSGPCTIETPGVSVNKSSNLRPATGKLPTERSSIVVLISVLVVSMVGTAVIVTFSLTCDTFILRLRLTARPTVSVNGSCTSVAKPCFETVSV